MKREVVLIAGARPNFMKIAPIAAAMRADGRLAPEIVHTEQHYDRVMSELFVSYMSEPTQLPPHILARHRSGQETLARVGADYIAGMTDRFALEDYRKLVDPFAKY